VKLLAASAGVLLGVAAASPAFAQVAVTSATLVERTMAPGDEYRDAIAIHNASRAVQVVSLRLADYRFAADGTTDFDPPATQRRSNGEWIALAQKTVSVPPGSDTTVGYTVRIPRTSPLPAGTYWSVVLVEPLRPETAPSAGFSVVPTLRYAIQIATHVGVAGNATLRFGEPHLVRTGLMVDVDRARTRDDSWALGTDALLAIDIQHEGTRACRPAVRLEIYGQDGRLVHSATAQRGLLYPGLSVRQTFQLPPLPTGDYIALLLADVGTDHVQGTKFRLHTP
jgi:hypothetical protein